MSETSRTPDLAAKIAAELVLRFEIGESTVYYDPANVEDLADVIREVIVGGEAA